LGTKPGNPLRSVWRYFLTWSPREVILLAIASATLLLAIGFAIAWSTSLVPLETVWGPIASWVNVGVTALGFLVAGLTFYLRFREVAQGDDEKKTQLEKDDLESTFQLQQLTASERQAMATEAALVSWELDANYFAASDTVPGHKYKYRVRFFISNKTRKRLTDVFISFPEIETHYGIWPPIYLTCEDVGGEGLATEHAGPVFAATKLVDRVKGDFTALEGEWGAKAAFENRAVLKFRVEGGPRWELPLDPSGRTAPTLRL